MCGMKLNELQIAASDGPVHNYALLIKPIDSLTIGVYKGHVSTVECAQVIVVKARALAKLLVVRLQRLRRLWVIHNYICTRPDLLHLLIVSIARKLMDLVAQRLAVYFNSVLLCLLKPAPWSHP